MHHVTLHKSSEDVDATHKADVKFNVMGPRGEIWSHRDAPRTTYPARQLHHGLDTYLPRDVLISINLSWEKTAESGTCPAGGWRVYRSDAASPTRVTLHPG